MIYPKLKVHELGAILFTNYVLFIVGTKNWNWDAID